MNIGLNHEQLGRDEDLVSAYERALELVTDYGVADDQLYAMVAGVLAGHYVRTERYAEAEPLLLATADAVRRLHGERHKSLASVLSQGLDGAPAVVLLAPVVIQTASGLGISPYPLMMGVSLAASAAFMTPFSHKANLLVMGAGGYKSSDYLRAGTPLTIVLVVLMVLLVPVFFPF